MLDSDPTVPWKGKEVRHVDGASGAILAPVHDMPGSFKVQFHDGIITNQKANVLLIDGKPLDKLMESFDHDFSRGTNWVELCESPIHFFRNRFDAWRLNQINTIKAEILASLEAGRYDDAFAKFALLPNDFWPEDEFRVLVKEQKAKTRQAQYLQKQLALALIAGRLWEADDVFSRLNEAVEWPVRSYLTLKRRAAAARLAELAVQLDEEQTEVLLRPGHRLLIRARAGSGKTRILAARASVVIKDERLDSNQVMILAFNKAAATEIKRRVRSSGKLPAYENARTFHSLAHQLVKPKKKLLFDAGGHLSSQKQSLFIQGVIHKILSPVFKMKLYSYFRKELEHLEEIGRDLSREDYFFFRRSLDYVSLSGDKVKSNGEKIIADFLFEHGIQFAYEKVYDWKKKGTVGFPYAPDFSILSGGRDFILEHWAIDPDDLTSSLPEEWNTDTNTYRVQIEEKRAFWRGEGVALLETHSGMQGKYRETLESHLQRILTTAGIPCDKVSHEKLIARVVENDFVITRLAAMFLQFIQRSKRRGWSPDDIVKVLHQHPDREERSQIFHELASHVYREYQNALEEQEGMDFDDLLVQATKKVKELGSACTLHMGSGKSISLGELRWILVDEFQDFSELYYRMLDAILAANPQIKLVAVGDDWQAINSFAGAELRFFMDFGKYFRGETLEVTTNYRSAHSIVELGNALMVRRGVPAKSHCFEPGITQLRRLDDVWIEFRTSEKFVEARKSDAVYLGSKTNGKVQSQAALRKAKALKACVEFALKMPDQDLLLLSRTNFIYNQSLEEFRVDLARILGEICTKKGIEPCGRIKCMTAHGSKGQEAPAVIVLDATKKMFPKIHPDNLLFLPFGVTPKNVLEEERRLFYVAVTRAKSRLLILTEKDDESPFLHPLFQESRTADLSGPAIEDDDPDDDQIDLGTRQILALVEDLGGFLPAARRTNPPSLELEWATIRADADPRLENLLKLIEAENLPLPTVAYELPDEELEACLAWPNAPTPVAILLEEQQQFAEIWKSRGFRIPPAEMAPSEIIRGLKHHIR